MITRTSPRTVNQTSDKDPFASDNPGPARAAAAVKAAEEPLMARAADYVPAGDMLYLRDIADQEVAIYNINPGTDSFGNCADLLVLCEGEEEAVLVHVSGFMAGRLITLRERIEAGECKYPLAARFEKVSIAGGKSVWSMI